MNDWTLIQKVVYGSKEFGIYIRLYTLEVININLIMFNQINSNYGVIVNNVCTNGCAE